LEDENDELRKMMGWLSGYEPQMRMMMETYKGQDGQALGSEKVGESSGEGGDKIGDIQAPPTYHKNAYAPKPNRYETNSTQIQIHLYSLTPQMTSKSLSISRAHWGMCSLQKRVRSLMRRNWLSNRVDRNQVSSTNPSLNLSSCGFIMTIVGDMVTRVSFASRRSMRKKALSRFSTAGNKFQSIVRRAWMVSAGDNGIYTSSGLRRVILYV
jgi:hypothetical protein